MQKSLLKQLSQLGDLHSAGKGGCELGASSRCAKGPGALPKRSSGLGEEPRGSEGTPGRSEAQGPRRTHHVLVHLLTSRPLTPK